MRNQLLPPAGRALIAACFLLAACAAPPAGPADPADATRTEAIARWTHEQSHDAALQLAHAYFPELQPAPAAAALDNDTLTARATAGGVLDLRTRGRAFTVTPHAAPAAALDLRDDAAFAGPRHLWWPAGRAVARGQGWQAARLEEAWILDELPARPVHRATYTVELPAGVRRVRDAGAWLEFLDEAARPILRFHPSVARDAHGASRDGRAWIASAHAAQDEDVLVVEGPRIELTTEVALAGLVPPLVIDPGWSSTASMAVARGQHAAIQLPDGKVLVAGGVNQLGFVAAAELYDPATGTWSSAGTPGIVGNVTNALLLPTGKVLVLTDGSTTGRLYDPVTATWSSTGAMSALRLMPTLTLLRSGQVLVAGGSNLNTAELYDPATNTFTVTGSMSVAHRSHTATLLRDGRVLVVSGFGASGEIPVAELYDPAAGTWSLAAPPLVPRHYATATLLPDGRVLLAGGFAGSGVTNHAELYDPAANTWTATGALGHPRNGHSATLMPDGKVLVVGGSDMARNPQLMAELYDPASGTWSMATTLAVARENHTATLLTNGKVLVAGGYSLALPSTYYADVELFRSDAFLLADVPQGATPQEYPLTALLPTGEVLITGGADAGAPVARALRFDPQSRTTAPAASPASPHHHGTATLLETGEVLLVGGFDTGGSAITIAERYDPTTDAWSPAASLNVARARHTATRLSDGRVLVVGGEDGPVTQPMAELYDPATNSWQPTGHILPRRYHAAALLPDGRVLVAGGQMGEGGPFLNDAQLYDPASNIWRSAASLASARADFTLTLLPTGEVIAVGGAGAAPAEIYDPVTNTWRPATSFGAQAGHAATLLPSGMLFTAGGLAGSFQIFDPALGEVTSLASGMTGGFGAIALPSGEALVVGGTGTGHLYDPSAAQPAWRPVVTGPEVITSACPATIQGQLFFGISAGSNGTYNDSSANLPVLRLQDPESGHLWTLPGTDMSPTATTVEVPSLRPGIYALTVFSNGNAGGRVVTVQENQAPSAISATVSTQEDTPVAITLGGTDPDPGQSLTWEIDAAPSNGTLSGTPPDLVYAPDPGFVGTDTFTFVVRDCGLTSAPATIIVEVTAAEPPVITCPDDVTLEATAAWGVVASWPDATADKGTITYAPARDTVLPLGTTTVTATATDDGGKTASCTFDVHVQDTTPPALTCPPDLLVEATSADGAPADFAPVATDAVTAAPEVSASHEPGSTFPLGETSVTVAARDEAGNESSCTLIVTVVDTTPPALTCPADVEVTAASAEGAAVEFGAATASDAVTTEPDLAYSVASGSTLPVGATTVTVRATDAAGNDATCTFVVTVREPPVVEPPAEEPAAPGVARLVGGGCQSADGAAPLASLLVIGLLAWGARRRRVGVAAATAAVALTAVEARAQITPMNLERLRFDPAATDALLVDTGRLLEEGGYRLSLLGNYERGSLYVRTADDEEHPLVRDRAVFWLAGAWSPVAGLELSARLPVIAAQGGADVGSIGGVHAPSSAGLGTPEVGARVALLGSHRPVRLALGMDVGLPGGSAEAFGRQDAWNGMYVAPRVALSTDAGPLVIGGNAGVRVRGTSELPGPDVGSELEQSLVVATRGEGLRGEIAMHAAESLVSTDVEVELLGGLRLPIGSGFEAFGAAGRGFTDIPGTPSLRMLAGIAWAQSPARRPVVQQVEPAPAPAPAPVQERKPEPAPAPAPPPPAPAPAADDALSAEDLLVHFAVGQAELTADGERRLDAIAAYLQRHAELQLEIHGHTDDSGSPAINAPLSRERARRVRDALVARGVSPDRLRTAGHGETRPVASNETEEGRRRNRRVDLVIVGAAD